METINPSQIKLSDVYKQNIDLIKRQLVETYLDWFMVFDGRPGTGKTNVGLSTCLYIDPTFNPQRVGYSFDEVQEIVEGLEGNTAGKAILWDEAAEGLLARDAMRTENREAARFFMRIRKKRIFFGACIPRVWHLDPIFQDRAMSLVHCFFEQERGLLKQGRFGYYASDKIEWTCKEKKYPNPDFTAHAGKVPEEFWLAVQQRNYAFLDGADANTMLRVKKLNKTEIERFIVNQLTNIIKDAPSTNIYVNTVYTSLKTKYGNAQWVTPKFVSKKLGAWGLEKHLVQGVASYILTQAELKRLTDAYSVGE